VTRILIADDHEVVREGLRRLLEAQPNYEVVAEALNGKDAVLKALETKPDIVVLDYSLPLVNGVDATRQIRSRLPETEVLIFTMHDDAAIIENLLRAGARGYVLKSDARRELLDAIDALADHKTYFSSVVSEALLKAFNTRVKGEGLVLTPRERRVVQFVAEGHTNKQIATLLNVSLKTVETHRTAAMAKLDLSSVAALVRYAVKNNIVES
jgi:DNA-binding NarL/FixJ family response regulator